MNQASEAARPLARSARQRFLAVLFLVAALAAGLARATAILAHEDFPHVMDEAAYELQAGMFANGRLTTPEARPYAAFNQWFVQDHGARYSIFPPGWPAVLACGRLLHIEEWTNPILHGLTVLLLGLLGRTVFGRRAGLLAAALYGASPQALILAGSKMSHTLMALLAVVVASSLQAHWRCGSARRWHYVGGAALGIAAATRPLCALVLLVVVLLGLTVARIRGGVVGRPVLRWSVAALPFVALLGIYNHSLTGSAMTFPQTVYFNEHLSPLEGPPFRYQPGCNDLGFGVNHGCEVRHGKAGHDLRAALENTEMNLHAWFSLTAAWGIIPLAIVVSIGLGRHRWRRLLLLAPGLGAIVAYGLYWYPGTCYGARFLHIGLPGVLLVAAGATVTRSRLPLKVWPFATALVLTMFALQLRLAGSEVSHFYWGTDARFREWSASYQGPDALVLVAFQTHDRRVSPTDMQHTAPGLNPMAWTNGIRFQSAMVMNAMALDGHIVFAKYHPALMAELRRRYPSRVELLYVMADEPRDDVVLPIEKLNLANAVEARSPPDNFNGAVLRIDRSPP